MSRSVSVLALSVLFLTRVSVACQQPVPLNPRPAPQDTHQESVTQPLDWFRRADKLTNLRLPGSQPFSMRVTFQAWPGIDFTTPGHSPILTGPGVYQESWVSPEEWRREVTLGSYHAVEIRASGKRTFQASSSYEPGRVMMLLKALLTPIPRSVLEPELHEHPTHLRLEHRMSGTIPWVRISDGSHIPGVPSEEAAYDFLPSGILVRRETGSLTSWDDDQSFAGRFVPRHVAVQGPGLEDPMVSAAVAITPLAPSDRTISQVPSEPADPGSTLQPIEPETMDNSGGGPGSRLQMLTLPPNRYPAGVEICAIWVVDKNGMPRDVEISTIRNEGQPLNQEAKDAVWEIARQMIAAILKDRFRPALIDGKPCQVYSGMVMTPSV